MMSALALIIASVALQVRAAQAFRLSANSPDEFGWVMSDEAVRELHKGIRSAGVSFWLFFVATLI